jgi:hypothetical protein
MEVSGSHVAPFRPSIVIVVTTITIEGDRRDGDH